MAYKRSRRAFEEDPQAQASPFVLYGTPLPPLDENARDDGSFVPIWKQDVTDERGRKRLHGAFTGGFSAGYFNTVGSKEGWTPASFVSSRQSRMKDSHKASQPKPEDFMDEEDLREAEESRTIHTSNEFAGFGTEHDAVRQSAMIDIFRPLGETVGSKLLKRMGWREGHGIGPRVRRTANLGDQDHEPGGTHLFAPEDVRVVSLTRKNDRKGLGYEGLSEERGPTARSSDKHEAIPGGSSDEEGNILQLGTRKKPNPAKKRTGFGVGILNDDGSGDDDPYSMGPKISHNKVVGGDKRPRMKHKPTGSAANPLVKNKPTFISKRLASLKGALRKCHDGRLPPDGFVLSNELDSFGTMSINDDKYRPPTVPEDWTSSMSADPQPHSESAFVSTADAARSSRLTAKSRASLLGETQLPGKSIFDFLTPASRDRLVEVSGRQNLPPAGSESVPDGYQGAKAGPPSLQSLVPPLEPSVALQALNRGVSGWMPYAEDENKRHRYRTYLEIQAGLRGTGSGDELPPRAENMRQQDWVLEMQEFARAAEVFKPVSGLMASRFTSSSTIPHGLEGKSGDAPMDALLSKAKAKPEDPAESAAKMGMFGAMTRSVSNFYPTRLLCKRFNVPMPTHEMPRANEDATSSPWESGNLAKGLQSIATRGIPDGVATASGTFKSAATGAQSTGLATAEPVREGTVAPAPLDPDRNEALEGIRPGQAVFEAIFGSDDEDE